MEDVSTNEPGQNDHQNDVQVYVLVAARRSDFVEKHRNQSNLESEAKITMREDVESFLLPHFEVSLLKLHLAFRLQLKSKLVLFLLFYFVYRLCKRRFLFGMRLFLLF